MEIEMKKGIVIVWLCFSFETYAAESLTWGYEPTYVPSQWDPIQRKNAVRPCLRAVDHKPSAALYRPSSQYGLSEAERKKQDVALLKFALREGYKVAEERELKQKASKKRKVNSEAPKECELKKKAAQNNERAQDYVLQPTEGVDRVYEFLEGEKFVRGHLKSVLQGKERLNPRWETVRTYLVDHLVHCEKRESEIDLIVKNAIDLALSDAEVCTKRNRDHREKSTEYLKSVIIGLSGPKCF